MRVILSPATVKEGEVIRERPSIVITKQTKFITNVNKHTEVKSDGSWITWKCTGVGHDTDEIGRPRNQSSDCCIGVTVPSCN